MISKQTLTGKVAVVTGGGTGIGKAICLALAQAGADIVVAARRVSPIEQTAGEVQALGRRALAIATDVTDSQQVNRMATKAIAEMGKVDILVNNAGIDRTDTIKAIQDVTDDEWHRGIDVNLTGAFFCCRALATHFLARKSGKVINTTSGFGVRGSKNNYMYCSAKGGLIQFTRTLALSWAHDNIQVNCMGVGLVDVRQWQTPPEPGVHGAPETIAKEYPMENYIKRRGFMPVGRIGEPEDIASLCLFLASDAADYITGAMLACDGGGLAAGYGPIGYEPIITLGRED